MSDSFLDGWNRTVVLDTIDLQDRGHCVHLPRIMPHLVHSVHRGHCVSGVLSSGSRIYLGGDDVISAVALRGISPRSMGLPFAGAPLLGLRSECITQPFQSALAKSRENLRVGAAVTNRLNARAKRRFDDRCNLFGRLWLSLNSTMIRTICATTALKLGIPSDVLRRSLWRESTTNAEVFDNVKRPRCVVRLALELRSD